MKQHIHKQQLVISIVVAVVLMVASFFLGSHHARTSLMKGFANRTGMTQNGNAAFRGGGAARAGGSAVMGSVLSKDATSMTVKLRDGSSKIVLYSTSTQVAKSTSGTADDVAIGLEVSVIGTQNADGSVTANSIQLRPAGMPQQAR